MTATGLTGKIALLCVLLSSGFGCAQGLEFTMIDPQESVENIYVGPDLELSFDFEPGHIVVGPKNVGGYPVEVDWSQAAFAGPDGKPVRLVLQGEAPVRSLRPGASLMVKVSPDSGGCGEAQLWNRRAHLRKMLVPVDQVPTSGSVVRLLLPVKYVSSPNDSVPEILQFRFRARKALERKKGGRNRENQDNDAYRELFE